MTYNHGPTIRSYHETVVLPAIQTLKNRIDELGRSSEPVACFEHSDMCDVLHETTLAFCLAIQSIWERQLRSYLRGCAKDLRPGEDLVARIENANWIDQQRLFEELRGIPLRAFPSFPELDTLHLLGNACRHGYGRSASELADRCPEWWGSQTPLPPPWLGPTPPPVRTVSEMSIPLDRIAGFVAAIVGFWNDATYIYNESISPKDPGLERLLARERAERAEHGWLPDV